MKKITKKNLIVPILLTVFLTGFLYFLSPENSHAIAGPVYKNPVDAGTISQFIENALIWIQGIVGGLAVLFVVLGGVLYIISGTSSLTNIAKAMITWALVGFTVAVAAPSILLELKNLIMDSGTSAATTIDGAKSLEYVVTKIMNFVLTLFGILAVISFVISGVFFVTSGGDSSRADTARKVMTYSIIAVSVAGGALIIIRQVLVFLGG